MPEASRTVLRDQLEDERHRLQEQLARLGHAQGESSSSSLAFDDNFADSGQVTAERGEVEALSGQLAEALTEIEDALAKLDEGTYGRCESCGQGIPEARLEAMPAARLCISCASQRR